MAEAARAFSFFKRERQAQQSEREALRDGLARTRQLINQAYANFNNTGDTDLIESYVFEINALQARYSYLLRRVKDEGAGTATAPDCADAALGKRCRTGGEAR